jgi:adenylate cyclase
MTVSRRLVAVFAADVEGYSRLMGADEVGTLKGLTERRAILDRLIGEHRGRIANTAGDSVLAEFGSAVDAVQCAVTSQAALAEANKGIPPDKHINFRIGVHIGDVMVRAGDLFGDGVNIAARLQALAHPGGVCVSGTTYEQVRKVLPVAFTDMGMQQVKNIEDPIRAYAARELAEAIPSAAVAEDSLRPLPLPDKPSIAVLPFQNISGDPGQEYFSDGMVEDIITALSRFKSLFVIARNSSFTYKGKAVDIKRVGRELGVQYVLEGSVRKSGNKVRITGQLIEAATNSHLWADNFDGELEDIFDLQDKVTASVVGVVAPTIEQAEIERTKHKPTDRLDSYDFFLRGMATASRGGSEPLEWFRKAITRDKEFAAAYAMAAYVLMFKQGIAGARLPEHEREEALELAQHAVRFGRDDPSVLARSAHVLAYLDHQYDRAALLADQAVALNSNLASAWHCRGWVKLMCVLPDLATESFKRMMRLSPLDPLTDVARIGIAFACFQASRYEEGLEIARTLGDPSAHSSGAFILNAVGLGRRQEAADTVAKLLKKEPTFRVSVASYIFPMRTTEMRDKIASALREAGVPD